MIRFGWCAMLIGWPLALFPVPVAAVLSALMLWAVWEAVAGSRDHWRRLARMRDPRPERRRHHVTAGNVPDELTEAAATDLTRRERGAL